MSRAVPWAARAAHDLAGRAAGVFSSLDLIFQIANPQTQPTATAVQSGRFIGMLERVFAGSRLQNSPQPAEQ
jgi:hypothetical protein